MQIEDILPLSPLQEGLLFHALYDAQGPDLYTIQLVLGLQGSLDCDRLKTSLRVLMQRHGSLRACFQYENVSHAVQIILSSVAPLWRTVDLSSLDEAEQSARLAEVLKRDRAERFDLSSPPLLRVTLIRHGANRHRLLLTSHHILVDGWSMQVLIGELLALYEQNGSAVRLSQATPYREALD